MNITGIILAAGTSSRMGSTNKLLLKYRDHTIIEEVLDQLSSSKVDDILIVTGFENTRIEELLADRITDRVNLIYNENYRLGRAESIKCAIRMIRGKADAALFMVADKPQVTSALINKAIDRFREDRPPMLYVETPQGRGHPVMFSETVFDDLLLLKGDCIGNELVAKYRDDLITVKGETPQIDIDTDADYHELLENLSRQKVR
jgi:molybdenum cofactor cytidylyltransferase